MLEKDIEGKVVNYARQRGCVVMKNNPPSDRGWPDRTFIYRTKVMFIEFKIAKGKPRPLQIVRMQLLEKQGMRVHLVDNVDKGKELIDAFMDAT